MKQFTDGPAPDVDPRALSSAEFVRRRFEQAWNEAGPDHPPPSVDDFLAPVPEPERAPLRRVLESLEQEFRRGGRQPSDTALPAAAAPRTPPNAPVDPEEFAQAQASAADTVDFVPRTAGAGVTKDGAADLTADPGATVDPAAGRPVGSGAADTVAGYEILGVLGRGAMGVVYKARQRGLSRVVALKMILSGAHASEHEQRRFRTEAEAVARIQHPNIVQIYEVGEEAGRPYFSLEYVDGGTLAGKINGAPQTPKEAARIVQLLAGAMDAAHKAGVVHRDLKPANVLLTRDGSPKITDFGLAKQMEGDSRQTHSGSILGSPSYMAPEQAEGKNQQVGPLADVYALGVILYELLTGRIPFRSPTVLETLELIRTREPVAPSELQPGVPRDVETICLKCLQKESKKRYADAAALAEDLRRYLSGEPILARPVGRLERAWRWSRRNPRLALMGAAVALALIGWAISMSVLAWQLNEKTNLAEAKKQEAIQAAQELALATDKANHNAEVAKANASVVRGQLTNVLHRTTLLAGEVEHSLNSRALAASAGPELHAVRNDVLNLFRKGMLDMVGNMKTETRGEVSFGAVGTYQEIGDLMKRQGQGEEAMKQYKLGEDLAEKIVEEQPDDDKARANLGVMLMRLGDMELELNGDARAAHDYYEKGRVLRQAVIDHPHSKEYTPLDEKIQLSHYEIRLGKADLALGDAAAARDHFDKAATLRKAWSDALPQRDEGRSYLTEAYALRGSAAALLGDAKGSHDSFDEALRLNRALVAKFPNAYWYKADLAEVLSDRAEAEVRLGNDAEAAKSYRESLESVRPAAEKIPDDAPFRLQQALAEEGVAAAARKDSPDESRKSYQQALRVRQDLLEIEPNNRTWQAACLKTLAHCGMAPDAAKKAQDLVKQKPHCAPVLLDAARCYAVLAGGAADADARRGFTERAIAALHAAAEAGYQGATAWKTDPELASLRGEAAYQALLQEMAKH